MCDRQITARRCCHNAPSGCTYALPGVCDFGATALALPLGGWQCGHQSRSDGKASRDETTQAGPQTQATRGSLFRAFVMTQPMQPQGEHLSCRPGNRATGAGRPEEPLGPDGSRLRCKPARCADHRRATLPGKRPPHPGCNSASRGLDCSRLRSWSCRLRGPGLCERGPGKRETSRNRACAHRAVRRSAARAIMGAAVPMKLRRCHMTLLLPLRERLEQRTAQRPGNGKSRTGAGAGGGEVARVPSQLAQRLG